MLGIDEEEARSFVSTHRVVEQTEDCRVVERLPAAERAPWPYIADPDGFETAMFRTDGAEWVLDTVDPLFDGCITTGDDFTTLQFGETYEVEPPTGGADITFFPAAITIPDDPQQECPTIVPGEPLELAWNSTGASAVRVSARRGDLEVVCYIDDSGSFTIPSELTGLLPDDGSHLVEVRPSNFDRRARLFLDARDQGIVGETCTTSISVRLPEQQGSRF